MEATVILIDSDAELARARALVERLWDSAAPADVLRLEAQSRLIAAYEQRKWPRARPSTINMTRHLSDQHSDPLVRVWDNPEDKIWDDA